MSRLQRYRPAGCVIVAAVLGYIGCLAEAYAAETELIYKEQTLAGARLFYQGEIPIAVLSGSPEQMGKQQAVLLSGESKPLREFPRKFTAAYGAEHWWPLASAAARTLMLKAPERYQRELAALVEHGEYDPQIIDISNTLLELRRLGCSTLIISPDQTESGGPLFGRNFDFPTMGILNKYSVLMVYQPEGQHAFASVGFPGVGGVFSGINDAGLCVAIHDVFNTGDGAPKLLAGGIPMALLFRQVLEECTTVDQAEKVLRANQATTWMNLSVCDKQGGAVFELTPKNVNRRQPTAGVLACTNHFQTEGLTVGEDCWRLPRLRANLSEGKWAVKHMEERLAAVKFPQMTLQTMVFEPATLTMHLGLGDTPTAGKPLTHIELAPLFAKKKIAEDEVVAPEKQANRVKRATEERAKEQRRRAG